MHIVATLKTPGEGLHKPRICGFAAVDLGLTAIVAGFLSGFDLEDFIVIFAILMMIATWIHIKLGINTKIVEFLGCATPATPEKEKDA